MGQKVNPKGIRLGITKPWDAKWFAPTKKFAATLISDLKVRAWLKKELAQASVSEIKIQRAAGNAKILVKSARPGKIIDKKGGGVKELRDHLEKMMGGTVHLTIEEVKKPELDSNLVAETIAQQLQKRIMFRRAMKRAVTSALRQGALGIKVCVSGRLGGAEIARSEWYREGRVPLHTFRADIDYGFAEAHTTYGVIGVKVWIFKGEVLGKDALSESEEVKAQAQA
jgi:small subunit ribosomal protein S3